MSWASEFPSELLSRPTGLVSLCGLDVTANAVHRSIWDAFSNNRKPDRVPLTFKLHDVNAEFPKSKPKRPTYDWYIPKGILKSAWMKKHLEFVPSLVVHFFDFDWNDPMWKEKQVLCSEKVKSTRENLTGRSTKVCIVLIQKNVPLPPGEDVVATERASSLCASCDLSNKLLFVLPITDHLFGYTVSVTSLASKVDLEMDIYYGKAAIKPKDDHLKLEHAFADLSRAYYHTEARKMKGHKDFLNKTTHALLFARHQFKIAFFNELKHDSHTALKHYKSAYSYILELRFLDFNILEIKTVAGFISYKICKLCFGHNTPLDAISQFRKHIDFLKGKVGIPELAFEHSAWMSKQFQVFGDIFDEAIKQGLAAILTQHPGIYYQQAAYHAMSRRTLSQSICLTTTTPADEVLIEALNNLDYYGQRPWRQGHQSIEPPDFNKEKEGIISLQALEKKIDFSKIIIPLLGSAVTQTKKYKSPRMKRHLTVQLLFEYYYANEFNKALTLLSRVTLEYRQERWWNILTSVLKVALKSAFLACCVQEYVTIIIELIGPYGLISKEEKIGLQQNLTCLIEGECPREDVPEKADQVLEARSAWENYFHSNNKKFSIVEMSQVHSFVECKVQFAKDVFQADEEIHVKVFLRSNAPETFMFKELSLQFNNDCYNSYCVLKSKKFSKNSTKHLVEKIDDSSDAADDGIDSSEAAVVADDDDDDVLTLKPGQIRTADFKFVSMICDVGGSIEVTSLALTMGSLNESDGDDGSEGAVGRKPAFCLRWSGASLDSTAPSVYLQKNFFPAPFKGNDNSWLSIRPDPYTKVVSRKSKMGLTITHDTPGFVGEMLRFHITINNSEASKVSNVRCNIILDPNLAPEVKGSTTMYLEAPQTSPHPPGVEGDESRLLPSHPIYVELARHLERDGTVEASFYTRTTARGKLNILVSVSYDIVLPVTDRYTECRCIDNRIIAVKVVDPLDVDLSVLSVKLEKLDFPVNAGQPFLLVSNLKNMSGWPLEIVDSRIELMEDIDPLEDVEHSLLSGEILQERAAATENFMLSFKESVNPMLNSRSIPLGKYVIFMKRTMPAFMNLEKPRTAEHVHSPSKDPKYSKTFSKIINLPSVGLALRPLAIQLDLPAYGVMHTYMEANYSIRNLSQIVQEIMVTLESAESFMFSGPKQVRLRVLPVSECQLKYDFVPLVPGNVLLPRMRIAIERFPDMDLDSYLEKSIRTTIFVKPKSRIPAEEIS